MSRPAIKPLRQRDAMDCGPSCLAMISAYYGGQPDREELRRLSALGRSGVTLLGLSKAAEAVGFRSVGGRMPLETLAEVVTLPCIAHWDQNHFVVVERIERTKRGIYEVHVVDPSRGREVYDEEEFCNHWVSTQVGGMGKGIALLLEPTEAFYSREAARRSGDKGIGTERQGLSRLSFLWGYVRPYRSFFLQLILGLIVGSLLQLLFPLLTQRIVDAGIGGRDMHFIWLILLAQSMLLVSRTAIDFIRSQILLHISSRINIALVSDFFIHLMSLPMRFFDTKLMGDLLQRIEDHYRVEQFLTSNSLSLLFSFVSSLIFAAVLASYSLLICGVFLLGTLGYGLWIYLFLGRRRRLDYRYFGALGRNRNVTYQLISGMQEIKLQGCQERKRWEWEDVQAELYEVNLERLRLQQLQQVGSVAINEGKNLLVTVLAAMAVLSGEMTLGMMLAVQYIVGQLNSPVEQLVQFIYSWQDLSISLERMNEIHRELPEEDSSREAVSFSPEGSEGRTITLEGLSFKYDPYRTEDILSDINLTLPNGSVTAIVGASGSGKTTLIKLLLGFYAPLSGRIRIGERDLAECNLGWWRSRCGAVMQEGYLFSDTIARNIAVSDDEPDISRLREAARVAQVAEYIESLPLGYNTMIGQDGQGISQGQRQRILIARMVYKAPDIVLLDEATNALDANNERRITESLREFYRGRTVVIVAHRLSTVREADQIVVLDGGRIIERGTHSELTALRGAYYELVRNQLELGK